MSDLNDQLDEIENTLADITNQLSQLPSDEEIESVRVEIFDSVTRIIYNINAINNQLKLISQRIEK